MRIGRGASTGVGLLAGTCILLGVIPGAALAQGGYLIFQAGYYVPTSDLGALADAGFDQAVEFGKRNRTFAYSLGLELPVTGPFSGRATLAYAVSDEVPVVEQPGCPNCEARSSLLTASAALVFRPLPGSSPFQPFVLAGGGIKHYDLESLDDLRRAPLRDQTRNTALVGAGLSIRLGPLQIVTELTDYMSPIFSEEDIETRQHDLFWTAGLMLGSG